MSLYPRDTLRRAADPTGYYARVLAPSVYERFLAAYERAAARGIEPIGANTALPGYRDTPMFPKPTGRGTPMFPKPTGRGTWPNPHFTDPLSLLRNTDTWVNANREAIDVANLDAGYAVNILAYLVEAAPWIARKAWSQLEDLDQWPLDQLKLGDPVDFVQQSPLYRTIATLVADRLALAGVVR